MTLDLILSRSGRCGAQLLIREGGRDGWREVEVAATLIECVCYMLLCQNLKELCLLLYNCTQIYNGTRIWIAIINSVGIIKEVSRERKEK